MHTDRFKYKEITDIILRSFYETHNELGDGFVELKAVRTLNPAHEAQLINYLKATNIEVGLLLNFGRKLEFKRFVFDNKRKDISDDQRKSVAE
ncbi:MAG: hypothetical protein DRH50_00205 [Deltaproteobacteria bacterium]|nr:MAG: hypothetical protein DRH50_00205 [Deltaproteobacteria bacterium]